MGGCQRPPAVGLILSRARKTLCPIKMALWCQSVCRGLRWWGKIVGVSRYGCKVMIQLLNSGMHTATAGARLAFDLPYFLPQFLASPFASRESGFSLVS